MLEIVILENVVYMGMKNDLAFLIKSIDEFIRRKQKMNERK